MPYHDIPLSAETLPEALRMAIEESEFLALLARLGNGGTPSRLFGGSVRRLSDSEIDVLRTQGNRCDDWGAVWVSFDFVPHFIFGCVFSGSCVIGRVTGEDCRLPGGVLLPGGMRGSTIVESEIGDGCAVVDAKLVSRCLMMEGSVLFNTGVVAASGETPFGNGLAISVGIETGGREVRSFAELSVPIAAFAALNRKSDIRDAFEKFAAEYAGRASAGFCVAGAGARIVNTPTVRNSFVGEGVTIDGAVLVEESTILGAPDEQTRVSHGAVVRSSIVQWGCEVTTGAIVENSVLVEHSHVERHGKVAMSVIGPNTGIAEGEVTSCLVGPFVGFHHQALLIAAVWPEGKGNIGYGANVGSNHTSKAPDQEIFPGEGVFFGLGCSVKFPADFSDAPYSIIATAVTTLPQRVEFPFSLINKPSAAFPGISSSFGEIFPGWVLSGNIYTVRRNELKFARRDSARRNRAVVEIFRQDIIEKMLTARNRLRNVRELKDYYTHKDVPGLGKNIMLERSRKSGVDAYSFYIEYYVLEELFRRISSQLDPRGEPISEALYTAETAYGQWEHARRLLIIEGFAGRTILENLERLAAMKERIASSTQLSKERDDGRGRQIIRDYCQVRSKAAEDPFIVDTWRMMKEEIADVHSLISALTIRGKVL